MNLYAASGRTKRYKDGAVETANIVIYCKANNEYEATGLSIKYTQDNFPSKLGWQDHTAIVQLIPMEFIKSVMENN